MNIYLWYLARAVRTFIIIIYKLANITKNKSGSCTNSYLLQKITLRGTLFMQKFITK